MKNFLQQCGLGFLILACAVCALAAQQYPPLDVAVDLTAIGKLSAQRGAPIMLVFTRPECPFCTRTKKEPLEALRLSQNYGAKVIMREIVAADNRTALRDFDGNLITHGEMGRRYDVRWVPTVIVVDGKGKVLAEPIIDLTATDFYNHYLEQAIEADRLQLRQ